jgi:hypothetical protein
MSKSNEEKYLYKFRKFAQLYHANDGFLKCIGLPAMKIITDEFYHETTFRLTWDLACRDLMELKWPYDWKQAFKERWFPGWLLKRYPVRYSHTILTEIAGIHRPDGKDYPVRYAVTKREL